MKNLVATFEQDSCKAEVYETALPGQFSICYYDAGGKLLAEEPLSGVSTYKQREKEITERLDEYCKGGEPSSDAALASSGEY